ncbi:histidine phosphatase family protein [soil metagenome]
MRLLLIRHGQTPANVLGALDTAAPGPGLTELGRAQAAAVPEALAGERIDGIYASRLVRTQQTAAPLARVNGEMHRVVLPGIHEIEAGRLEGRRDKRSITKYMETVWAWRSGSLDARMPGGPDGHEFYGRFDADIAKIGAEHAPDATVAVFSHGAAIRVWSAARARNVAPEGRTHLDNTGVVVLVGSPADGWIMESFAGEPVGGAALEDPSAADPTGN